MSEAIGLTFLSVGNNEAICFTGEIAIEVPIPVAKDEYLSYPVRKQKRILKKMRAFVAAVAISVAVSELSESASDKKRIRKLEKKLKAKVKGFSSEKILIDAFKRVVK